MKVSQQSNVDSQKDVAKLNTLISANHDQENSLQNANYVLEMESIEELRDMEKEGVTLQASIQEVALAKATLLDEIVENERQALLWEKKIQLDKEMREALDPTIGQLETQTMEKEIHRMNLRYEALLREQERLSIEMEQAILKRSSIALRYNTKKRDAPVPAAGGIATTKEYTISTIKKKVAAVKKEARALADEHLRYDQGILVKSNEIAEMTADLERLALDFGTFEEVNVGVQGAINDLLYQKQLRQERIAYRLKYLKRLKAVTAAGIEPAQALAVERKLLSATQGLDNVRNIIFALQEAHPHLHEVLQLVATMTESGIDEY